jgi:hypothetical protein
MLVSVQGEAWTCVSAGRDDASRYRGSVTCVNRRASDRYVACFNVTIIVASI